MREIVLLVTLLAPLSVMSFGGGSSILAPLQHAAVGHYGWLSEREFIDYFAISRAAPGPASMVVALVGWKVAGVLGALVAMIAIYLPSSMLCYGLAKVWNRHRGTALHTALERGLIPIGTGLTIAGAIIILRTADTGPLGWLLAAAATAILVWRNIFPLLLLAAGGSIFVAISLMTR
jgi:chromate transporter